MAQNFLSCDRDQVMLLPVDMAEWLPAGHLARFVIGVVDQLDLRAVYSAYRVDGRGRPAHDPAMMTALVLYNYAVGIRSSRQIERRCVEDVACRVIAANRQPDHVTIARFRQRFEDQLSAVFFQVLAMCRDAGMVRVGVVAVDSTKLAADASLSANRTGQGLREEAQRIVALAGEIDAREDELFGERRGDELPAGLADPGTRAARIGELLERVNAREERIRSEREEMHQARREHHEQTGRQKRGRPPADQPTQNQQHELDRTRYNVTDPDTHVVRHRGMMMQGVSVQTAVGDGQVILSATVGDSAADQGQLAPVLEQAAASLTRIGMEAAIDTVLADTGYWSIEQIIELTGRHRRVLVPPRTRQAHSPDRLHPAAQLMVAELSTPDGKAAYRRRQQIVEPVFAHIKHHRGITRLLRRGRHALQAEIDLIATTHNLLKLYRHPTQAA